MRNENKNTFLQNLKFNALTIIFHFLLEWILTIIEKWLKGNLRLLFISTQSLLFLFFPCPLCKNEKKNFFKYFVINMLLLLIIYIDRCSTWSGTSRNCDEPTNRLFKESFRDSIRFQRTWHWKRNHFIAARPLWSELSTKGTWGSIGFVTKNGFKRFYY